MGPSFKHAKNNNCFLPINSNILGFVGPVGPSGLNGLQGSLGFTGSTGSSGGPGSTGWTGNFISKALSLNTFFILKYILSLSLNTLFMSTYILYLQIKYLSDNTFFHVTIHCFFLNIFLMSIHRLFYRFHNH